MNAKASSPPRSWQRVGGSIVVRGWESQPQGEGSQGIDVLIVNNCLVPEESQANQWSRKIAGAAVNAREMTLPAVTLAEEVANPWRARCSETGTPGSEGGVRRHSLAVRLAPTRPRAGALSNVAAFSGRAKPGPTAMLGWAAQCGFTATPAAPVSNRACPHGRTPRSKSVGPSSPSDCGPQVCRRGWIRESAFQPLLVQPSP